MDTKISEKPKSTLAAYKDLARPFTLLMPFIGFLAGAGIASFAPGMPKFESAILLKNMLLGAIAASILNAASNAINQYYDFDIDVINKPDRPLPNGDIPKSGAIRFGIGAYLVSMILASFINTSVLILVVITALITFFYSAPPIRFKNHPVMANVAMAVPRGLLLPVVGWLAVYPYPEFPFNPTPWAIGTILFLYVVGAATTKDYADMKGDKECGARTLPVILGVRKSAFLITPFFVFPFLLVPVFISQGWIINQAWPITLLAIYGSFIAWLILRDPESLALEGNHPSWKHMYLLTMAAQLGFLALYGFSGTT